MGYPEPASAELGVKIAARVVEAACAKIEELEEKADGVYREVEFVPEPLILE